MSNLPKDLKYTEDHEWVKVLEDGVILIGITDYAQESLGDITFVELPDLGKILSKGTTFGVVESVKAASDLFAPVSGEVIEVNESLDAEPELVNDAPYEGGWMLKLKVSSPSELDQLLPAEGYQKLLTTG